MMDSYLEQQQNWYAVQTKPYREDQAASNIRRLGLTVLLPKIMQEKLEYGNRRTQVKPLFPGYLFARFSPSPYFHSIRYARGVTRVLCAGETPVPLSEEVIDTIQSRVGKDGYVKIGCTLREGEEVVINEGPLRGLIGVFERELSDGERAVVLLQAVEYQVRVFVERLRLSAAKDQQ
jgi:transcriptional antiterminator RfaH